MSDVYSVLTSWTRFGQYVYGIYLGFNGEIPLEMRSIADLGLLISQ